MSLTCSPCCRSTARSAALHAFCAYVALAQPRSSAPEACRVSSIHARKEYTSCLSICPIVMTCRIRTDQLQGLVNTWEAKRAEALKHAHMPLNSSTCPTAAAAAEAPNTDGQQRQRITTGVAIGGALFLLMVVCAVLWSVKQKGALACLKQKASLRHWLLGTKAGDLPEGDLPPSSPPSNMAGTQTSVALACVKSDSSPFAMFLFGGREPSMALPPAPAVMMQPPSSTTTGTSPFLI